MQSRQIKLAKKLFYVQKHKRGGGAFKFRATLVRTTGDVVTFLSNKKLRIN